MSTHPSRQVSQCPSQVKGWRSGKGLGKSKNLAEAEIQHASNLQFIARHLVGGGFGGFGERVFVGG